MIQRIQTVWLFLCAACASLAFVLPFGTSFVSEVGTDNVDGNAMNALTHNPVALFIINIIICSLIAMFSYKKRNIQKLLTIIAIIHAIVGIGFMIYLAMFQSESTSLSYGIVAPFLAFVFALLALKGIRKDDKLVKNLDRLR